ncbi:MAG: 3-phosphoshikimate 1-carboxyvinyltransferase [Flavobacteriales bacterium]|nr:3-phosphoshikimate 1-carboxyvinyltransferase [Flavobacteriales bacterium]
MIASLSYVPKGTRSVPLKISGSKSESNRLLILQAYYPTISIDNLSGSDDTQYLKKALRSKASTIDIHHAGTAMRFLTAYFAAMPDRHVLLTGSERMQQRPIKILVDALRDLGAAIEYTNKDGYPPLQIKGTTLLKDKVRLSATVSSQYISALLLIAPSLPNGLTIVLDGTITSAPYLKMTLSLLEEIGAQYTFLENTITVRPLKDAIAKKHVVESDWSSASYFYSLVALDEQLTVTLQSYRKNSLQGDMALATIYQQLGVKTTFNPSEDSITLTHQSIPHGSTLELNLSDTPDIAQTIAVSCFAKQLGCNLTGLHTLKIKETDRLLALKVELEKLGAKVTITDNSLTMEASEAINKDIQIATYNDHRMAMAFAPLASKVPITIQDAMVVTKSYPDFWKDLERVGISVQLK